ncbi:MAG TPA: acyltransferase [Gemmatimonadales bacterium]|nr:acyltransferase [Gemmatimonadales bacterium]
MRQLDGVRAVAAGMVVCYHFYRPARQYVHLGGIGVRVFFVLSGFLITGILLRTRLAAQASGSAGRGVALRRFYIRRILRIFPLYYFALGLAWLTRVDGARESIAWHATYLSNVRFFLQNAVDHGRWGGHVGHFWSLAVEEQFYLLWPWVIFFAPRRWLPAIALGLAAFGPVFRYVVFTATDNDITSVLLPGCIDSLALGAYLAMSVLPEFKTHPLIRPVGRGVLWAGVALFAAYQAAELSNGWWTFRQVSFDLAVAILGLWVVANAARGFAGPVGRFLDSTPVRYLGTISYGIYVYHLLLPAILPKIARRLGHPDLFAALGDGSFPFLVFYGLVTIVVAAVSWHAFEAPINRLKDRFEYR